MMQKVLRECCDICKHCEYQQFYSLSPHASDLLRNNVQSMKPMRFLNHLKLWTTFYNYKRELNPTYFYTKLRWAPFFYNITLGDTDMTDIS